MSTQVISVDCDHPDQDAIRYAARVIRAGGLVAFPTETVYGLGANALDPAAVARIFEAKGRPATNPLIVHVAETEQALSLASSWPNAAGQLASRFWPGPLTIVVPRRVEVPDIVTAGGPTVAIRCPNHPVARLLIREAGVPIAAPSANRSTDLSPTRAAHVLKGLDGRIDLLLDGGPCPGGIESTVVDVSEDIVRMLRPGLITIPMLEEVLGRVETGPAPQHGIARSPGSMLKHYSPRTPLLLAANAEEAESVQWRLSQLGLRIVVVGLKRDSTAYAADLYATLHEIDAGLYDRIVIEMPPDTPEWAGVRDRLLRAGASGEWREKKKPVDGAVMLKKEEMLQVIELWNGGQALEAGKLVFESLPDAIRPRWAVGILRLLLAKSDISSPLFDQVLQTADHESMWRNGHHIFSMVRGSVLKLDDFERRSDLSMDQKALRYIMVIAELVMKVTYNATNPNDAFDEDSGWWIVKCLRGFVDSLWTDEEFSRGALATVCWRGE